MHNKINDYMKEKGIKQMHIVNNTKIEQAKLSRILSGKKRLTVEDYELICEALGLSPTFFFN